jgi:hypothetical protein
MSEDTLRAVLGVLPGFADEVRHRLGLTHEETYAALVRLYEQERAAFQTGDKAHTRRPALWARV